MAGDAAHLRNLNTLYAGVLHSLRGPVNAIAMNLELLRVTREDDADTPARARDLRCIDQTGKALTRLTALLEAVGEQLAPDEGRWQKVDLSALLRDLELLVDAQARSQRVALRIAAPDEPVLASARPRELQRALLGLLAVGLRSMQDGGELSARLENRGHQALISLRAAGPALGDVDGPTWELVQRAATRHGGSAVRIEADTGRCVEFRLPVAGIGETAERE